MATLYFGVYRLWAMPKGRLAVRAVDSNIISWECKGKV